MPNSDPQSAADHELVWLLHSALAWALTGALILVARRPLWDAVGVTLMALGFGVIGWVVRRLRRQPPQQPNWIFRIAAVGSGSCHARSDRDHRELLAVIGLIVV